MKVNDVDRNDGKQIESGEQDYVLRKRVPFFSSEPDYLSIFKILPTGSEDEITNAKFYNYESCRVFISGYEVKNETQNKENTAVQA